MNAAAARRASTIPGGLSLTLIRAAPMAKTQKAARNRNVSFLLCGVEKASNTGTSYCEQVVTVCSSLDIMTSANRRLTFTNEGASASISCGRVCPPA
jgi:hypothetical protein